MGVFGTVIGSAAGLLAADIADQFHRGFIEPEPISHNHIRIAIAFHGPAQNPWRCVAIPPLVELGLQHFAPVIDDPPKIVGLTVSLHEGLVEMRSAVRVTRVLYPLFADLRGEHRPKRFRQNRTLSCARSISRSWSRSSTFRRNKEKRMYIITAQRTVSGEVLKYFNGLRIGRCQGTTPTSLGRSSSGSPPQRIVPS